MNMCSTNGMIEIYVAEEVDIDSSLTCSARDPKQEIYDTLRNQERGNVFDASIHLQFTSVMSDLLAYHAKRSKRFVPFLATR